MYVKYFSNVKVTQGKTHFTLIDTQRQQYYRFPNELLFFANLLKSNILEDALKEEKIINDISIHDFYEFFESEELVFTTKYPELFPEIDESWNSPFEITNMIIDLDDNTLFDSKLNAIEAAQAIGIRHLQFRYYDNKVSEFLDFVENKLSNNEFDSIELMFYYIEGIKEKVEMLLSKIQNIFQIFIYKAPAAELYRPIPSIFANIIFTQQELNLHNCGMVENSLFITNLKHFTESQHHNTCLNRKISIDVDGNIKNCPSMAQSFGNIRDTTLQEALDHPDFKKYWNVKKDEIAVCKDCEFRHICTDCRAYIENPEDMYSKPLKCGYNPYTAEWEEWSTNPLKQKAITYYGMQELLNA
jgi:SPASM domain peptide maturase of grasp-with-spasm system